MPEFPVKPPHEAGARIRVLANHLTAVLGDDLTYPVGHFIYTPGLEKLRYDLANARAELLAAIDTRRTTLMREKFTIYTNLVARIDQVMRDEATKQIRYKKTPLPLTKEGITVQAAINELRNLANNLPTQPDLPSADSRDTALRAIIAVLRTHEFPGTEKLTHQAKEDPNATTQQKPSGEIVVHDD